MAVPEPERQLNDLLLQAEERLTRQSQANDEIKLKLVKRDEQLSAIRLELANNSVRHDETDRSLSISNANLQARDLELAERMAYSAAAALELTQRTAQLRESNEYLQYRTAELEKLNTELKSLMQQREDFVAALTHDLKNPLIAATKQLQFMLDGRVAPEEQNTLISQLLDSNKVMLRMVWNLLDVYRHEAGSLTPSPEPVEIGVLLKQCIADFSISLKEKQIALDMQIEQGLPPVHTDRILLRRVLINLIDNAIKFTPQEGSITITAWTADNKLYIAVEDSGYGMSEQQLTRLFQRFWQAQKGRANGLGSGLGLFLSKQIMTALGGTIACTSKLDQGTKFVVALKIDAGPA
ncbi:MAG: ATP-binding protein [Cyanobacteria bacterium REEB67]|nr:ATP-binding protein [Cyanobacteria bacterium REEB67]